MEEARAERIEVSQAQGDDNSHLTMHIQSDSRVAAITHIYAHASTFPCRVTTAAGTPWVMKLAGSGPGPVALLTEYVALRLADAMGLPVPSAKPLYLDSDFPWTIGTDEFDGIVQRSGGWNLGVELIGDAANAAPDEILSADPDFLDALSAVDRLLCNVDRTLRNPNILRSPAGMMAIDFDACLFLRRAASGVFPSSFPLPRDHLLGEHPRTSLPPEVEPDLAFDCLDAAPPEWTSASGRSGEQLAAALRQYIVAWNTARASAAN